MNLKIIHYFLIVGIVGFSVSMFQCYPYLAEQKEAGLVTRMYCSLSFSQFFGRSLSISNIIIHLLVWLAISMILYRLYMRFLHGRFP